MRFIKQYWPWLIPIGFMITYELVIAFGLHYWSRTLSSIVVDAPRWLEFVVVPILVILVLHFWHGLWNPRKRKS